MICLRYLAILFSVSATPLHAGAAQKDKLNSQDVERGRHVYQQHCAACHGERGEGQPNWQTRNELGELPAPPHDASGHTWKHADGMLYKTIRNGWRDPFNKTPPLTMPAYADVLDPGEIRAVITYLKTLWTPEQRRIQRDESRKTPFPPDAR